MLYEIVDYSAIPLKVASPEDMEAVVATAKEMVQLNQCTHDQVDLLANFHPFVRKRKGARLRLLCSCGKEYLFFKSSEYPKQDLFCDNCMAHLLEYAAEKEMTPAMIAQQQEAETFNTFWWKLILTPIDNVHVGFIAKVTGYSLKKLVDVVNTELQDELDSEQKSEHKEVTKDYVAKLEKLKAELSTIMKSSPDKNNDF